jgi:hypothetical protein
MYVTDDAYIGHLEDGRIGVLVDRHHEFGIQDASVVLDGPGDAAGNIEIGA